MIFGKSSFDLRRALGLLFFWISSVSLWSYFVDKNTLFFDVHDPFILWFDRVPTIVLLVGFLLFSLYLLFHVSYKKILTQFGAAGSYAYHKQVELLNTFSDSIQQRQAEKAELSPKEEQRLKHRNEELGSKIEKLSQTKNTPESPKVSFFEKLKNQGTVVEPAPANTRNPAARSIPIVTKNVATEKHHDIKPFHGSWQYPKSDLLTLHAK